MFTKPHALPWVFLQLSGLHEPSLYIKLHTSNMFTLFFPLSLFLYLLFLFAGLYGTNPQKCNNFVSCRFYIYIYTYVNRICYKDPRAGVGAGDAHDVPGSAWAPAPWRGSRRLRRPVDTSFGIAGFEDFVSNRNRYRNIHMLTIHIIIYYYYCYYYYIYICTSKYIYI